MPETALLNQPPILDESQRPYWGALAWANGLGAVSRQKLLAALGSPEAIWQAESAELRPHIRQQKSLDSFLAFRAQAEPIVLWEKLQAQGIGLLCQEDAEYPELLRYLHDAPPALFYQGHLSALSGGQRLAVVGTRAASDYGKRAVETLLGGLKGSGLCIVSGFAQGIDTVAHRAALVMDLPTVAVFGTAIDTVYPSGNRALLETMLAQGGLALSEYSPGTQTLPAYFPQRNRIVAGLCQAVLVVEGDVKSGALITARQALAENRQVLAVPGNIFNPMSAGPHWLIREGATPITSCQELLMALGGEAAEDKLLPPRKDAPDSPILAALEYEPMTLEALVCKLGKPLQALCGELTLLELDGWVQSLSGGRYVRS